MKLTKQMIKVIKKLLRRKVKSIKDKVYFYLKSNKVAVTKRRICKDLNLRKSSVNRACTILRKEEKIGCTFVYAHEFPGRVIRTYWGVR